MQTLQVRVVVIRTELVQSLSNLLGVVALKDNAEGAAKGLIQEVD